MSDDSQIIEKLYKVATAQQKIIVKLCQTVGMEVPSAVGGGATFSHMEPCAKEISMRISKRPEAQKLGLSVASAKISGSGELEIALHHTGDYHQFLEFSRELRSELSEATVTTDSGKQVPVHHVALTGLSG